MHINIGDPLMMSRIAGGKQDQLQKYLDDADAAGTVIDPQIRLVLEAECNLLLLFRALFQQLAGAQQDQARIMRPPGPIRPFRG